MRRFLCVALSGPFWGVMLAACRFDVGKPYQPYQPYQCRSGAVRLFRWYGLSRTSGVVGGAVVGGWGHLV
jgi:hypothetical protein